MKNKIEKYITMQDGYSIILVPIMLTVLIGFFTFVADYGRIIILKHQIQTAVDSATIAGASMFKVEFEKDETGKVNMDKTVTKIVEDKAIIEADKCFNKNVELLGLDAKGIKVLEKKTSIEDGSKFKYRVQVQMPINQIFVYLGARNLQNITVTSEAKPEEAKSS